MIISTFSTRLLVFVCLANACSDKERMYLSNSAKKRLLSKMKIKIYFFCRSTEPHFSDDLPVEHQTKFVSSKMRQKKWQRIFILHIRIFFFQAIVGVLLWRRNSTPNSIHLLKLAEESIQVSKFYISEEVFLVDRVCVCVLIKSFAIASLLLRMCSRSVA